MLGSSNNLENTSQLFKTRVNLLKIINELNLNIQSQEESLNNKIFFNEAYFPIFDNRNYFFI